MKYLMTLILCLFSVCLLAQQRPRYVMVIHGGAGSISSANMPAEKQKLYKDALQKALDAGTAILEKGGSALDAVTAAIQVMEEDTLFNAGRGAVFTHEGKNELDASVMDGETLNAGAVAGVTNIKSPICAARAVMEQSKHVMLAREGAEVFASEHGCETVDPSYFYTQHSWNALQNARKRDSIDNLKNSHGLLQPENPDWKYGTVGAVALDTNGNLAAGTSTGGMTNKRFGRVGDSPIIGAGTYADNNTCAISCTGWGEFFIRLSIAKAVSDRLELTDMHLEEAATEMIMDRLEALGGDGGLIAVDKNGNITMPFNTTGMLRAYKIADGESMVMID